MKQASETKPSSNEPFSAFMARLKEHSKEYNLDNITHIDVILLCIATSRNQAKA